jgi:hypothetical protein
MTRADAARITLQRIGDILQGVPLDSILGADRPRIQLKAGDHVQDPDREGQLLIAFSMGFNVDL